MAVKVRYNSDAPYWLVIPAVIGLVFGIALTTWFWMLVLGGLHGSVWERVPALGFWPTMLCVIVFSVVAGSIKAERK